MKKTCLIIFISTLLNSNIGVAHKKFFRSDHIQKKIKLLMGKNIERSIFASYINDLFFNLKTYLKVKNLECTGIVDIGESQEQGIIWETKNFKLSKNEKDKCLYEQNLYELEVVDKLYKKRRYYTVLNHREELKVLEEFHTKQKSKVASRVKKLKQRLEKLKNN
ncbi:hypothetical protein N9N67_03770 [Bacteriovoracaceae bacterium]|nr:hypothetical protein [Bacteriovoracaceae bacterium]